MFTLSLGATCPGPPRTCRGTMVSAAATAPPSLRNVRRERDASSVMARYLLRNGARLKYGWRPPLREHLLRDHQSADSREVFPEELGDGHATLGRLTFVLQDALDAKPVHPLLQRDPEPGMVHDHVPRSLLRHLLIGGSVVQEGGRVVGSQVGDRRGLVVQLVRLRRFDFVGRDAVEREKPRMPLEVRPRNADLLGEA